jgi:DNA-binding MarR family transcriptional regulator
MEVTKSVRRHARTDSNVPPVGETLDLSGLPLTALVARLSHQLVSELASEYTGHELNVQPLDASLLILLAMGGARLTDLADRLNTSKQALTFVISRLERDGYVVRSADSIDKRAKRIELTDSGRAAAVVTEAALRRIERRWRARVGDDWPQVRAALARAVG